MRTKPTTNLNDFISSRDLEVLDDDKDLDAAASNDHSIWWLQSEETKKQNPHGIKILHIEDDPFDSKWIRANLQDVKLFGPIEIVHAENLQQGFEYLSNKNIDLVITDLSLPDCHGGITVAALVHHFPRTPILVLTGNEETAAAVDSFRAGAKDYFVKRRFHDGDLLKAMKAVLT